MGFGDTLVHTWSTGTPDGETGPVRVINAMMTADVLGCELQGGLPPPSGLGAFSQGSLQAASPPSPEVMSHNGYCPAVPCPSAPAQGLAHSMCSGRLCSVGLPSSILGWGAGLASRPSVAPDPWVPSTPWPLWCVPIGSSPGMCQGLRLGLTSIPSWVGDVTPSVSKLRLGRLDD